MGGDAKPWARAGGNAMQEAGRQAAPIERAASAGRLP
jgi:hypothetical protein